MFVTLVVERTDAQDRVSGNSAWGNVSFSNHLYSLMFFDHETGQIYIYSDSGRLQEVWSLKQLGKDLVKEYDANKPGAAR
jgi:hypothetical protein